MASPTADLITRLARPGADAAWGELAERHGPDVWRLIASRLGQQHEVEDAYQEFWLALPAAARRFRPWPEDTERKARAWLMHIAYTTAIAQARQRPHAAALDDGAASTLEADVDDGKPDAELIERVRQAVDRLPETHRQPLLLHTVGGLSYEDLAAELRCTVNNARVKVHRAIAALRALVGPEGGRLSEQGLAALLVPPLFLVAPPPPPALPALPVAPPPPGILAVIAKAPIAAGAAAAATATAVVTTAVLVASPSTPEIPVTPTAVIATVAAAAALTASDDFNRATPGLISPDPTVTVALVDAPAGGGSGKALSIAWPKEHKPYWQVVYEPFRPAPELTAAGATVTLKVWVEAMSGVKGIALRLVDANHETFQWAAPLPDADKAGWRTLSIAVDPQQPVGSWGPEGKVDKIIDWPVTMGGFAADFSDPAAPGGSLIIDDVVVTPVKP